MNTSNTTHDRHDLMRAAVLVTAVLCIPYATPAQNLVPNPGFETERGFRGTRLADATGPGAAFAYPNPETGAWKAPAHPALGIASDHHGTARVPGPVQLLQRACASLR